MHSEVVEILSEVAAVDWDERLESYIDRKKESGYARYRYKIMKERGLLPTPESSLSDQRMLGTFIIFGSIPGFIILFSIITHALILLDLPTKDIELLAPIISVPLFFLSVIVFWKGILKSLSLMNDKYEKDFNDEVRQSFEMTNQSEIKMSPELLLEFWDSEALGFINSRTKRVNHHLKSLVASKEECLDLQEEIRGFEELKERESALDKIGEKIANIDTSIVETKKVNEVLVKVNNELIQKIQELKSLIRKKVKLEEQKATLEKREIENNQRLEDLKNRISSTIGDVDLTLNSWESEKSDLEAEILGLMKSFKEQLASSSDLIHAEIELEKLN